MATQSIAVESATLKLELLANFPGLRVLAWQGDNLCASRGYSLLSAKMGAGKIAWRPVARYRPEWWRSLTCRNNLSYRLVRDGFHALAVLSDGRMVAALPGVIATLRAGETQFCVSHRLARGTRPLHITATPQGKVFWGEYFDNPDRQEVHIYASGDGGIAWGIAYTFGKRVIRHVHNILYDRWDDCLWILTGDYGRECKILRASPDFKSVDEVRSGDQQSRAVAAVITEDGLYFASDTPLEQNHIYYFDRRGRISALAGLPSSSIYGCKNRNGLFFSTMIEPTEINRGKNVTITGSADGSAWQHLGSWQKDCWPMRFFQYGNAFFPDGENASDFLAASTIAVEDADLQTSIWRVLG